MIELLPVPEGYDKYSPPRLYDGQMFHEGQMRAYARANSARAIAPLQAEIEALRETLATLKAENEKLREALRELVDVFSESGMYDEEVFDKARNSKGNVEVGMWYAKTATQSAEWTREFRDVDRDDIVAWMAIKTARGRKRTVRTFAYVFDSSIGTSWLTTWSAAPNWGYWTRMWHRRWPIVTAARRAPSSTK